MGESARLIDQALEVGAQELNSLLAGDIDMVEKLSNERGQLMGRAFDSPVDSTNQGGMDALRDKLLQLQSLQGRLTEEARRLHESVRKQLVKTKREETRHAGYGKASKAAPMYRISMSKRG